MVERRTDHPHSLLGEVRLVDGAARHRRRRPLVLLRLVLSDAAEQRLLLQRGEKLQEVNDKAKEMNEAASEFNRATKQLLKQQKERSMW